MDKHNKRKWGVVLAALLGITLAASAEAQQGQLLRSLVERGAERRAALVADLALTATQQAALAEVEAARRQFALQLLLDLPPLVARVKADLANPQADLRATVAAIQATVDRELASHRGVVAARLEFYDSLGPQQQAQVRAALLRKLEALEQLRAALAGLVAG